MALQIQLSGGASNTDPNASLGGVRSGTLITDATEENLIDNIKRKEILVSKIEYRGFYIYNTGSNPVHGAVIYVDEDPNQTEVTFGLDPAGTGNGTTTGVMQSIATEDTSPSGITFEDIGEFRLKLPLPLLPPNEGIGIWMRRTSTGTGAQELLTVGITATGNEEALPGGAGDEIAEDEGLSIGERTSFTTDSIPFKVGAARIGFAEIG